MNRRNFIVAGAVLAVPLVTPVTTQWLFEDEYDRFLRELSSNVKSALEQESGTLQRLWIDPLRDGKRLVHLVVSDKELTWFQNYKGA
jgi:hypothetical protein